mgnify:CR=1 FL=1
MMRVFVISVTNLGIWQSCVQVSVLGPMNKRHQLVMMGMFPISVTNLGIQQKCVNINVIIVTNLGIWQGHVLMGQSNNLEKTHLVENSIH